MRTTDTKWLTSLSGFMGYSIESKHTPAICGIEHFAFFDFDYRFFMLIKSL